MASRIAVEIFVCGVATPCVCATSPSVFFSLLSMFGPEVTCFCPLHSSFSPAPAHFLYRMTYRDFQRHIDAFTHGVQAAKFTPKHKIVIWAKDCAESVVAQLGASKAGIQVEVLGSAATSADLEKALTGARAILFSPTMLPEEGAVKALKALIPELEGLHERADQILYSAKFPALTWVFNTGFERVPGMLKFEYILAYKKGAPLPVPSGSIEFAGPGSSTAMAIPYLDPEAKTPVVEPSTSVA